MKQLGIALVVVAACATQGCAQGSSQSSPGLPTGPTGSPSPPALPNWVAITDITPARSTFLSRGAAVSFEVTVRYALTNADSAQIVLIVQSGDTRPLQRPGEQPVRSVSRGEGTVSLSSTVDLPEDGINSVNAIALLSTGNPPNDHFERVGYPVR